MTGRDVAPERTRRRTLVGPHLDEIVFHLNDFEVRPYASQGQHRTVGLALRLATFLYLQDRLDFPPVLLLDDVFSELDPERAKALATALPEDTQTLITSARPEDVPVEGSVWRVGARYSACSRTG